jgi:N-acetylneuraminic acid mutarotase
MSRVVAKLPRALSDLAAASTSNGVYLVGGYDAHVPRQEIYRTTDGAHFTTVARLPVGLRYPAVATAGSNVVIAGGTSTAGASDSVYVLDAISGKVRLLGHLPTAVAHAQAVTIGGAVYVAGGVDAAGTVTGGVTRIDVAAHRIVRVSGGVPVSDAPTVSLSQSALVVGGATGAGATGEVRRLALR